MTHNGVMLQIDSSFNTVHKPIYQMANPSDHSAEISLDGLSNIN